MWVLPVLCSVGAAAQQGADDRLLVDEFATYPYGKSCAMASTPDGQYLFASEGGTVAFIDADPTVGAAQVNYQQEIKRVPIGRHGVVPVEMLYDDERELLYIAGGRDGLWVMDAQLDAAVQNLAWRVDDKGNQQNLLYQRSRKWCDDLFTVTIGEGAGQRDFLVALFGKRDASHLCFYWLDEVRAVANGSASQEYGNEILPRHFLVLPPNPNPPSTQANSSFAFAMDVDRNYDTIKDEWTADIYIAMGQHGLLRAHVEYANSDLVSTLAWGPKFGDLSQYALQVDSGLYGDVRFKKGSTAPYDAGKIIAQHPPYFLDVAVDDRGTGKHRLYAACDNVGLVSFDLDAPWNEFMHQVATTPSRFHQEGMKLNVMGKFTSKLVADSANDPVRTFARRVRIVDTVVGGQPSAALVVGTHRTMFTRNPADRNHGRSMDFLLRSLGGIPGYLEAGTWEPGAPKWKGPRNYSIVYDLASEPSWTSGQINASGFTRMGPEVHVFDSQKNDSLSYYVSGGVDSGKLPNPPTNADIDLNNMARVDYVSVASGGVGWPPPPVATHDRLTLRENEYRHGRWVYRASPSPLHGNLINTTFNDAGFRSDGPLVLDLRGAQPEIAARFQPSNPTAPTAGTEANWASEGIMYEPLGAYISNGKEYRLCLGRVDLNQGQGMENMHPRFRLRRFILGSDIYNTSGTATPPQVDKQIFFEPPPDKFGTIGVYTYASGYINAAYNASLTGDDAGKVLVFATLFGTPTGCWVMDMKKLVDYIDNVNASTVNNGLYGLGDQLWNPAVEGELTTHPEFWNLPDVRDAASTGNTLTQDFLANTIDENGKIVGNVLTMFPEVFEWQGRWLAAIPAGSVYCDDQLDEFQGGAFSAYAPEAPFRKGAGLHHMMIRFFDITDSNLIKQKVTAAQSVGEPGSPAVPGFTIIGPQQVDGNDVLTTVDGDFRPKGSACYDLEIAQVEDAQQVQRLFCFATDMAGSVQVFEITNILNEVPDLEAYDDNGTPTDYSDDSGVRGFLHYGATLSIGTPFASILTRDAISDGNPANAWGIEVDQVSFVDFSQQQRDEVYVYVSVLRVGIEVFRFDVDAATQGGRLRRIDLIQTPGEDGFLHLWEGTPTIEDPSGMILAPLGGSIKKLLYYGDARAGLRIFGYED